MNVYIALIISQLFLLFSCNKEINDPIKSLDKIEKKVVKIAKNRKIPSLAVSIQTKDKSLNFSYNHKDVEKQEIYGVGSTTKFLSSILIFKLIEDGELNLTDSITKYMNSISNIEGVEQITIRNLLNHTSGLSDYSQHATWFERVRNGNPPITFEEKRALVDSKLSNTGVFSYSNTNFLFLEKVVESITNKTYISAFDSFYTNIGLSKIKMGNSNLGLQAFFGQTAESSFNSSQWKEYHGFAGSAYSEPNELNLLLHNLFVSKTILNDNTITQMKEWITMQPKSVPIGTGSLGEYGNGIMKLAYKGKKYIGHAGGTLKYQSFVFFNEEDEVAISVTTNCSGRYFNNVFFQELIPEILDEI